MLVECSRTRSHYAIIRQTGCDRIIRPIGLCSRRVGTTPSRSQTLLRKGGSDIVDSSKFAGCRSSVDSRWRACRSSYRICVNTTRDAAEQQQNGWCQYMAMAYKDHPGINIMVESKGERG